jgi:hypothetical protein
MRAVEDTEVSGASGSVLSSPEGVTAGGETSSSSDGADRDVDNEGDADVSEDGSRG